MATSQNGWPANDVGRTQSYKIPGTSRALRLVKGPAGELLTLVAAWVHRNVEKIDQDREMDDWGYAERPIRGSSTTLSNHASGTAADLNATQHPLGVKGTWPTTERAKVNGMLSQLGGTVRWGDNYSGRKDGMHFEINVNDDAAGLRKIEAAVATMKRLLGEAPVSGGDGKPKPPPVAVINYPSTNGVTIAASSIAYGVNGGYFRAGQLEAKKDVDEFIGLWRRHVPASMADKADRDVRVYDAYVRAADWAAAGAQLRGILKSFQAIHGLEADGVFGPKTAAAVAHYGYGVTEKFEGPDKPAAVAPVLPKGELISLDAIDYAAHGGYFHIGQKPALEDAQAVAAWLRRLGVVSDRDERVWRGFVRIADWKTAGAQYAGLVRKFQARYGLEADGLVGPKTKAKLRDLLTHDNYRVTA